MDYSGSCMAFLTLVICAGCSFGQSTSQIQNLNQNQYQSQSQSQSPNATIISPTTTLSATASVGVIVTPVVSSTAVISTVATSISPTTNMSVTATPTSAPLTTGRPKEVWWVGALWCHVKSLDPVYGVVIMACILGLFLILLLALCCLCCRYRSLKRRTHFPKNAYIGSDTHDWIHSNEELLMWERNLRASEVNANTKSNSSRPPPYNK